MKNKKQLKIDVDLIEYILDNIQERGDFIEELLNSLQVYYESGNEKPLRGCLDSWEATAEINSIPGARETIMKYGASK